MDEQVVDKRVYKTLMRIEKGIIKLLENKPYNEITVKDICSESGISRGTFYQHYKDKDDFLYKYIKAMMKKGKTKFASVHFTERLQFFKYALEFWMNEGELFLLLLKDNGAYTVHQIMKQNLQQNIEISLIPIVNTKTLTNKEKYFLIIFMSNAVFGVLQDWVKRDRQESPKELTLILEKIFNTVFV